LQAATEKHREYKVGKGLRRLKEIMVGLISTDLISQQQSCIQLVKDQTGDKRDAWLGRYTESVGK